MTQGATQLPTTNRISGIEFAQQINVALDTIASRYSGSTDPGAVGAYREWADTGAGLLKMRNAGNTGWIIKDQLATERSSLTGFILPYGGGIILPNTLLCNGARPSRVAYPELFKRLVTDSGFTAQNFTTSIANPALFTRAAHGFVGGERLRLSTTGTLPTGLNTTQDYFVDAAGLTTNNYYLLNAQAGSRVVTSGAQSGVHSYLQSLWGLGDGVTTFDLPDLRGESISGFDAGRGIFPTQSLNSWKPGEVKSHSHAAGFSGQNAASGGGAYFAGVAVPTQAFGGPENTVRNYALNFLIFI